MSDNPYNAPRDLSTPFPLKQRGRFSWMRLILLIGIGVLIVALIVPGTRRSARPAAYRMQCSNNLKQIGLALHNYESTYHSLPPAYTVDAQGQPLHSWRTLILPYLEQQQLYETIDLSKPWDDPVNALACATDLNVYRCPTAKEIAGSATYMAVVGPNACFHPARTRTFAELTDGTHQTLMVIEVPSAAAVPWMSPQDVGPPAVMRFGEQAGLGHSGGINVVFADGSIQFLSTEISASILQSLISIDGNDSVSTDR